MSNEEPARRHLFRNVYAVPSEPVDQIARRTSVQVGVRDHIPNVKTLAHGVSVDGADAARLALVGERFGDLCAAIFHGHPDIGRELQILSAQVDAWIEARLDDDAA